MENAGSASSPESQVWYISQGKNTLFAVFRAIRENKIPDDILEKWITFFKSSEVIQSQ
jgi:hypothetical protein